MKVIRTNPFKRDYKNLPEEIQRNAEQAFRFLLLNPRHPGLQARLVDRRRRIWKAKLIGGYRFTFQMEQERVILRRIGRHGEMERKDHW